MEQVAKTLGYWTGKITVWILFFWVILWFSAVISTVRASEVHFVNDDPGGVVIEFINRYGHWAVNNDTVVVQGECDSACTIMLGLMNPERICATKNAEFGFHSASLTTAYGTVYSPDATQVLWFFYANNDRLVRVLKRRGWSGPSKHPELLMIDAQEIVRPCTAVDYGQ